MAPPPSVAGSGDSRRARELHFSDVQQLEILAGDGIFVALAQEADVVGIFQIFEASRDSVPSS